MTGYRVLEAIAQPDPAREFAVDVLVGLTERPKRLSSRWFYDAEGSRLFEEICEQPEYYLTRAEHEVLEHHGAEILAEVHGQAFDLVDLGAGDGRKTSLLLDRLQRSGAEVTFVPIDVSESAMEGLVSMSRQRFPDVPVDGLVSDYMTGLDWLAREGSGRRKLTLFLGSNIGNFDTRRARQFLRRLWHALEPGDLVLLGFDLKKDIDTLLAAYNDAAGTTKAFNLNLLRRINDELGADFDLERFSHFGTYNVFSGAMESYLMSLARQTVRIEALQRDFEFAPFEPILTEYSFKYLDEDVTRMAAETGFTIVRRFWDDGHRFCDALWRVEKAV